MMTVMATNVKRQEQQTNLICEELHAEGAVDNVPGGALEARVRDPNEGWCEGVVILELHHQAHVVQLLVLLQSFHVLRLGETARRESVLRVRKEGSLCLLVDLFCFVICTLAFSNKRVGLNLTCND